MAHDVFLSYGREDTIAMQQVEKTLREAGFTIWTDRGITPGSPSWKAAIEQAILESRCIVVLFSPESSESWWVRAELDYADTHGKPIYPLLVRGDATNAIPFGFTSYQWIDLRKSSQWASGLLQLTAALRGESPPLPTATPAARSNNRRLLLLAAALLIVVVVAVILLINRNAQTVVAAIPTTTVNAAQTSPTPLPTMPPFTLPEGFKKVEGEHTLIAVPSNWSTSIDPIIFSETFKSMADTNKNAANMIQMMMKSIDAIAIDMIKFQAIATAIENFSVGVSYPYIEARQRSIFLVAFPNGTFADKGLVETPSGTMLMTEASDISLYLLSYSLIRGTTIYNVYFNGNVADKETINSAAEQIIQSFRVKEG